MLAITAIWQLKLSMASDIGLLLSYWLFVVCYLFLVERPDTCVGFRYCSTQPTNSYHIILSVAFFFRFHLTFPILTLSID